MKRSNLSSLSVIALVIVALAFVFGYLGAEAQTPVGSGFTYQGRMFDATNAPVQGTCDLSLRLYDQDTGGAQIGSTVTITSVAMTDGYFDVAPDFGAPSFNGEARWLEIESACPPGAGSTTFQRQVVNVVPYALYALNSSITSTVYVTDTIYVMTTTTSYVTNTLYVTNSLYVTDTFYYTPSYHLQGWETITGTPSAYTPTDHMQDWSTITGTPSSYAPTAHNLLSTIHGDTTAANPMRGDIISGQGPSPTWSSLAKGLAYAVLTGDGTDTAWSTFLLSGLAGGKTNFNVTNAKTLTLTSANDYNLTAEQTGAVLVRTAVPAMVVDPLNGNARGMYAVDLQQARMAATQVAHGTWSTIGGGGNNTAFGGQSTIAGGYDNSALDDGDFVAGGVGNSATGTSSTIVGGAHNTTFGDYSTAFGGTYNYAGGDFSVACGRRAIINTAHDGSFLFADQTDADFNSVAANEVAFRAQGGMRYAWDNSNYWTAKESSIGAVTLDSIGSGAGFTFSDPITVPSPLTVGMIQLSLPLAWSTIISIPATYTPTAHTQSWSTITDQPSTYTPTLVTHTWTGLQTFDAGASATSGQFINALTNGATGGFRAGASSDALLYQGAADTWRTPDSLIVDGSVGIGTVTAPGTKLEVAVADGVVGSRIKGTTGIVRLYPYYNATYGSLLEALKPTESGYVTFTLSGSPIFLNGNVGIGTVTPNNFTLQVAGNVGPNASNTYDLGSASNYWATIHYHTLTSHSLSVFNTTVTLQDGREVSCLDALKEIKADPSKTIKGIPHHMDYATIPAVALNAAPIVGFDYRTMTATKDGEDGADLDMMVSLVLCADKELDAKSTALDDRMSDLEKRIADLEQKVK